MLSRFTAGHPDLVTLLHAQHGPLLAFAAALVLALIGRFWRIGALTSAAGAAGVLVGWSIVAGGGWLSPRASLPEHLPLFAGAALALGLLADRWRPLQDPRAFLLVLGLFAAWGFGGMPRSLPELYTAWPICLGILVTVAGFGWLLRDPCSVVLAGLSMAASLHLLQAPFLWVLLALTPALAAAGSGIAAGRAEGERALGPDLGAIASVVILQGGRLPHQGIGAIDVAALSPLLAVVLAPPLIQRLRFTSRLATPLGYIVAGAAGVAVTWAARQLLPHG